MKNNRGFVLVETLVVTVFVMTVLTILAVNYTPALSEFERREYSDDVDSKYDIYWVKKMVESDIFLPKSNWNSMVTNLYTGTDGTNTYRRITKADFPSSYRSTFVQLIKDLDIKYSGTDSNNPIPELYITKYSLSSDVKYECINNHNVKNGSFFKDYLFKNQATYGRNLDPGLVEYIEHLPDYVNVSHNTPEFRLIAKFERKIDPNLNAGGDNIYNTYATIEVMRECTGCANDCSDS